MTENSRKILLVSILNSINSIKNRCQLSYEKNEDAISINCPCYCSKYLNKHLVSFSGNIYILNVPHLVSLII